jgi:tetratricopeptide (TPR) repeat protein
MGKLTPRIQSRVWTALTIGFVVSVAKDVQAADLTEAESLFRTGQYAKCETLTTTEITKGADELAWWTLKTRAEMARGNLDAARKTIEEARGKFPTDLAFHLFAQEVYKRTGREQEAAAVLTAVQRRIEARSANSPADRIALGQYLLANGTDAKEILDQYFKAVVSRTPDFLEAHFAIAELAIRKHDRSLATDTLQKAPKVAAQEPRFHYLLALAFAEDDRARSKKAITDALAINPHHSDSLLLQADFQIDAEDFTAAEVSLKSVLDVDPGEPRAWAYRAVIAHLNSNAAGETAAREKALARWPGDPHIDHLIGRKLSQDYRFKEGAAYQRRSLEKDKGYLPAKAQLCQDLLRLGEEAEGWKLAAEVYAIDGYDVVAHNLISLRDHLAKFRTLAADGFLLRMDEKEADLYGTRALTLLRRARQTLGKKYDVKLDKTVTVEIFPRNQDFAVRTFGMPGADGYLGVCFGPVITANSPASQGKNPSNWEAVLWHELCHTVTLRKTNNKMPRWLSEGISVYEETRENSGWGRWMNPKYREMILGDEFIPLSRLSSAFLSPKSALHVQFAYFASALAVEFYIDKYGFDSLKGVLDDLGAGVSANESLARHAGGSLVKLDREFAEFARDRAKSVATDATWEKFELPEGADSATVGAWLKEHPKNFWAMQRLSLRLIKEQKWDEAESALQNFRQLYPEYIGGDNAYELLAVVYQKTRKTIEESAVLEELAKRDADATEAHERLIELYETSGNWSAAARHARNWLAVNPLTPAPHRALAKAAEHEKERSEAIAAYRAVLRFGVPDASDVHYRLARLLDQNGERDKARREVLKSLEEAPRFREAHELLLKLVDPAEKKTDPPHPETGK